MAFPRRGSGFGKKFSKDSTFEKSEGKKFGGPRKFGGPKKFGSTGRAEMHDAICSKCNNPCQVPFRPNGKKPIFCSTCFDKNAPSTEPKKYGTSRFEKPSFPARSNDDQFKMINAKLDTIMKVLASHGYFDQAK